MEAQRKSFFGALATPLASIFGSGFLVIIPILAATTGIWSVVAMLLITAIAFCIGGVIRFNIRYAEPALKKPEIHKLTVTFERIADIALVFAYIISISLYLRILASFLLVPFDADIEFNEQVITTTIIAFIILFGILKGLKSIENLEVWSLGLTMIIIFLILLSFGIYDIDMLANHSLQWPEAIDLAPWNIATILAGTLIVVQGFETSRYLGEEYNSNTRIRSSRASQLISMIVYLLFVALATPLMHYLHSPVKSNDLIILSGKVIFFLPMMVIFAAILSQFSAAVADTIAGVGNLFEESKSKISINIAYLIIGVSAVALTWSISTFQLVAFASRGFALYYLLQCFVALSVCHKVSQKIMISLVASILLFVTLFAVPIG
ncbi:MAG: hypothetical protein COA63_011210 [Methylophaga sp.]|nr:hypothetical protein [Methylophaga sp.]